MKLFTRVLHLLVLLAPLALPHVVQAMTAQEWVDKGLHISERAPNSDEEAQCYRQALAQDANHASAHFNLAYVLDVQGSQAWRGGDTAWDDLDKYYEALKHYAAAASLDPARDEPCENVLRIAALMLQTPTRRPPDLHFLWSTLNICAESAAQSASSHKNHLARLQQLTAGLEQQLSSLKGHLPSAETMQAGELVQRLRRSFTRGASPYQGPRVPLLIQFDYDSAAIKAESEAQLREVARALENQALAGEAIVIEGHADSKGDRLYNQRLSEQRASSVREYLARLGVSANRLQSRGYGEERPLVPNDSEANRAMNRRVEFVNLGALENHAAETKRSGMSAYDLLQ